MPVALLSILAGLLLHAGCRSSPEQDPRPVISSEAPSAIAPAASADRKQPEPPTSVDKPPVVQEPAQKGSTVRGRLVDQDDQPVAQHEVWLARAEVDSPIGGFREGESVAASTTTDAQGGFEFAGVSAGGWRVGPAIPRRSRRQRQPIGELYAPVAERVEVPASGSVDVVVRTQRGLAIRGRVVDPSDRPVAAISITGRSAAVQFEALAHTDAEGRFELGPLRAGEYMLIALATGPDWVSSAPTKVKAADADVVLRLRPAGKVRGRVVDWALGSPVDATITLTEEGGNGIRSVGGLRMGATTSARFEIGGLAPGTYGVFARTDDERCGVASDIRLELGATVSDVKVVVRRAVTLRVRCAGEGRVGRVQILQDDVHVDAGDIPIGTLKPYLVPPGKLTVRTWLGPVLPPESQVVEIQSDPKDVVIRPYK